MVGSVRDDAGPHAGAAHRDHLRAQPEAVPRPPALTGPLPQGPAVGEMSEATEEKGEIHLLSRGCFYNDCGAHLWRTRTWW